MVLKMVMKEEKPKSHSSAGVASDVAWMFLAVLNPIQAGLFIFEVFLHLCLMCSLIEIRNAK